MNNNLFTLFKDSYKDKYAHPFLVTPAGDIFSFGDIHQLSGKFAAALLAAGSKPGDRIVVQIDKSPAAVALYLACLRTGSVYVPLNTAYTATEIAFFLADATPTIFICRPGTETELWPLAEDNGVRQALALGATTEDEYLAEIETYDPFTDTIPRNADDLAAILYTSGTTGRAKGAMLSHGNLAANALTLHRIWGFRPDDVLLHALPVFHVHGLFVALHCALLNASKVLFHPGFNVEQVQQGLTEEATVMMGVPTFYTRLLSVPDFGAEHCKNVRLFISGSAPMTEQTHEQWFERTGHRILERYGMTEAGMITSNPLAGKRIPGTVGYPLTDVEVRITNDDGSILPAGETGSIEIRGPNVFKGYWRLPEKTREEFRPDGFFITGDLGMLSADGRLAIAGRGKDLIISGGYNVYPKEVEMIIDKVEGIKESAVIGLPHPDFGEAVTAVIVCENNNTTEDGMIYAACNEHLARFKHPKHLFYVDELPRNAMGKVQKDLLRKQYADCFN